MSEISSDAGFPKLRKFFDRAEYLARLEKVRTEMVARGMDLLIVSDPANIGWMSGYDGYSFYNHQCVVVSMDNEPVWFGRGIDLNGA